MQEDIDKAIEVLKNSGTIIFPTETLYGLGAIALDFTACAKVFKIKNRPKNKPVPVIVGGLEQLNILSCKLDVLPLDILKYKFWPGPLSVLLPARESLPLEIVSRDGLVCVRYTSHPIAQILCLMSNSPLVATSANISGQKPPKDFEDIHEDILSAVDYVVSKGPRPRGGAPSTIIEFITPKKIRLIRSGAVSTDRLIQAGFDVVE